MKNGLDKKHAKALTPRPPLGWNSCDCYGCSANQRVVRANLDAFAQKLKPAGWFGLFNRAESPCQGELDVRQIGIDQDMKLWDVWRDCPVNAYDGVLTCELEADDIMFARY